MSHVLREPNSIVRTAADALGAKYSSIISAGYSPQFHSVVTVNNGIRENHPERTLPTEMGHVAHYRWLLQSMTEFYLGRRLKRQSPLVNAGYAIRVACVLRQVESFVSFHRHCPVSGPIQIIVLGCGLDVTGLWSLSFFDECDFESSSAFGIHVVEIDFPCICESKHQAIQSLQLLDNFDNNESCLPSYGVCSLTRRKSKNNIRFSLVSANLENALLVEKIFSDSRLLDANVPTLVLSELVLTYLSIERRDSLLRTTSSLFQCRGSCTILYEPLGPSISCNSLNDSSANRDNVYTPMPVLESYRSSYCEMFNSKLRKGLASKLQQAKDGQEESTVVGDPIPQNFHPLGSSTGDVDKQLRKNGYEFVYTAAAGRVASSILHENTWKAKELFDEHAALTLHLCSYVVACAFPKSPESIPIKAFCSTENIDAHLFHRFMSPWISTSGFIKCPIPIHVRFGSTSDVIPAIHCCWVTSVQKGDEKQIRRLFSDTYQSLSEKFPSVRKMVKTALRKDLGASDGDVFSFQNSNDFSFSIIEKRYQELGGDFVVAVQYSRLPPLSSDSVVSEPSVFPKNDFRHVLGAIGIRKCNVEECLARSMPPNATCYEIHRFFVDTNCRSNGIGTALFRHIEDAVRRRHGDVRLCYLIATTPTVLESATMFYTKHGFDVQTESDSGGLTIRTYVKRL